MSTLAGPAKRFSTEIAGKSRVDLDFAGYVPNNWRDYNAKATIFTFNLMSNKLFGGGASSGRLILVRGPYLTDLPIGAFDPVTDAK